MQASRWIAHASLVTSICVLGCGEGTGRAEGGSTLEGSTGITSVDGTSGDGDPGDGDPGDDDPGDGDGEPGDGDPDGPKFDLGTLPDTGNMTQGPTCKVVDDMDAIGDCEQTAPPDAFEPVVQWSFMGLNGESQAISIPSSPTSPTTTTTARSICATCPRSSSACSLATGSGQGTSTRSMASPAPCSGRAP